MDAEHEKKQIKKQNKGWTEREPPKKNSWKNNHPWFYTCHLVKSTIDKLANFDIYENDIEKD